MDNDLLKQFPVAQPWSLLAGTAGKGFIIAGLAMFILSLVAWMFSRDKPRFAKLGTIALALGTACLFGAMGTLIALFVRDQFQYEYVFARADTGTALKYKIAGVWSGQQGSFLLWACASTIFGWLAWRGTGIYRRGYAIVFAAFLGALCGILAYETPFNLMPDVVAHGKVFVPTRGNGLTPSLQNYWVVIHPPTIFLGFGALTVLFAYSVAALMTGNLTDWVPKARSWALVALSILGLGIAMGGFWAYETLGWGGFWAWDPVENVSFVPWLVLVSLVHGMIVQTTRKRWFGANLWLAALPFLLFVYGTFLTRSGFLSEVSVHSFAQMDASALKILMAFLVATTAGFGIAYGVRGRKLAKAANEGAETPGLSREAFYRFGATLLSMIAVVISLGMSWPVLQALMGRKSAVVEEALYHRVLVWFFIPLMLAMALGPFVSWRAMTRGELFQRTVTVLSITIALLGVFTILFRLPGIGVHMPEDATIGMPLVGTVPLLPWIVFLTGLCLFVVVGNVWRIVEIARRSPMSVGGFVAHLGLATLLAGLILSRGFEQKAEIAMRQDQPERALDYVVAFQGITGKDPYDREGKVLLQVVGPASQFVAKPGLYYFRSPEGDKAMVWPHIQRWLSHDLYLAMGEPQVFAWEKPEFFRPGETRTVRGVKVTYHNMIVEGTPGTPSAKFLADLTVEVDGKKYQTQPSYSLSEGPSIAPINSDVAMTMPVIRADDRSVGLQAVFATPIYPINLYYKPLTILVWIGTGILFLGGMLSAWYRRPRRPIPVAESPTAQAESTEKDNAPLAVA